MNVYLFEMRQIYFVYIFIFKEVAAVCMGHVQSHLCDVYEAWTGVQLLKPSTS